MVESLISNRALFPSKQSQKKFLDDVKKRLNVSWTKLADISDVNSKTLRDWKNGKFNMSHKAACSLSKISNISLPKTIKIRSWNDHLKNICTEGGQERLRKYGAVCLNEKYRKSQFKKWWDKTGKFKKQPILERKLINYPKRNSELAEFVGIMMGDGGISKYQLTVTLHKKDDKEYGEFVTSLIEKLFHVPVSVQPRKRDNATNYVVSRIELVHHCVNKIGLKQGNKIRQQIDIPDWIKQNKKYSIACIRGLVDTDGSIFTHRYKVNGKLYSYKKMGFTSRSKPLIDSVFKILDSMDLSPRITKNYDDVRIDSIENMKNYFKLIGTHNPKHLKRYEN